MSKCHRIMYIVLHICCNQLPISFSEEIVSCHIHSSEVLITDIEPLDLGVLCQVTYSTITWKQQFYRFLKRDVIITQWVGSFHYITPKEQLPSVVKGFKGLELRNVGICNHFVTGSLIFEWYIARLLV